MVEVAVGWGVLVAGSAEIAWGVGVAGGANVAVGVGVSVGGRRSAISMVTSMAAVGKISTCSRTPSC